MALIQYFHCRVAYWALVEMLWWVWTLDLYVWIDRAYPTVFSLGFFFICILSDIIHRRGVGQMAIILVHDLAKSGYKSHTKFKSLMNLLYMDTRWKSNVEIWPFLLIFFSQFCTLATLQNQSIYVLSIFLSGEILPT
jgi:hypothetical protein